MPTQRDVQTAHRVVWDQMRGSQIGGTIKRAFGVPGFVESLRLLIEVEQYHHVDVGLMFGVSRERVRQWAKLLGLRKPCRAPREWVAAEQRFRPVPLAEKKARKRIDRRAAQNHKVIERRRALLGSAVATYRAAWRPVTKAEIVSRFLGRPCLPNQAGPRIASLWSGRGCRKGSQAEFNAACAALGVRLRVLGGRTHTRNRTEEQ